MAKERRIRRTWDRGQRVNVKRRLFESRLEGKPDPRWFGDPAAIYRHRVKIGQPLRTVANSPQGFHIVDLSKGLDKGHVIELGHGVSPISYTMQPTALTLVDLLPEHTEKAKEVIERCHAAGQGPQSLAPEEVRFITADLRKGVPQQLGNEHFSLAVMSELLTHIPPRERPAFLRQWAERTDSFIIVDRHTTSKGLLKKFPEYMNGREIKQMLSRLGFECTHYSTRRFTWHDAGQPAEFPYFFLVAKRRKPAK